MKVSFSEVSADILEAISSSGLGYTFRQENVELWSETLKEMPFIPVSYSHASIDYQLAYQQGHGGDWLDISIVILHGNHPCGVWPLSYSVKLGEACISSHGLLILPPLFVNGLADKSRKAVVKMCQGLLENICRREDISCWESFESFVGSTNRGLSEWHLQAMTKGASVSLGHELFVDLSLDIGAIKSYFRKSFKPLINLGLRIWKVDVMSEGNATIWNEFRELHFHVSGRITRSSESWDIQYQAIVEGNAILIFLRNEMGAMVGGGYFFLTRDQGLYGVGAYDRSMFDKPLGHVVQFQAIEEMKKRGLRWYNIGLRLYPVDSSSKKEISISEFKQGFATHFFPQYKLRCEIE